jgi:hypothetical protein
MRRARKWPKTLRSPRKRTSLLPNAQGGVLAQKYRFSRPPITPKAKTPRSRPEGTSEVKRKLPFEEEEEEELLPKGKRQKTSFQEVDNVEIDHLRKKLEEANKKNEEQYLMIVELNRQLGIAEGKLLMVEKTWEFMQKK